MFQAQIEGVAARVAEEVAQNVAQERLSMQMTTGSDASAQSSQGVSQHDVVVVKTVLQQAADGIQRAIAATRHVENILKTGAEAFHQESINLEGCLRSVQKVLHNM